MKFYISAPIPSVHHALSMCEMLKECIPGCSVPSWPYNDPGYNADSRLSLTEKADRDLQEVKGCDIFVMYGHEGSRGGRFAELGIALALGKTILAIGKKSSVFCYHERVIWFESETELLLAIGDLVEEMRGPF